jgi:integrase/recombinase XerC
MASMLRSFCEWAGEDASPGEFGRADIELRFVVEWQRRFELRNRRPPSTSTIRGLLLALKGLFDFLDAFDLLRNDEGILIRSPLRRVEIPPAPAPACRVLTRNDADALLRAARTPRQRIVLNLLRWSGLRAGEAAALVDDDVDEEARTLRVRLSKTVRGRRTIPLLPPLVPAVAEWRAFCEVRGLRVPGGPFLPTQHGTAMHTRYIWLSVRRVAARAAITTTDGACVSPHVLRRTFATDLLNRGVRLEVVSRLLGHASTTITEQAYAVLSDERIRYEVQAALGSVYESAAFVDA